MLELNKVHYVRFTSDIYADMEKNTFGINILGEPQELNGVLAFFLNVQKAKSLDEIIKMIGRLQNNLHLWMYGDDYAIITGPIAGSTDLHGEGSFPVVMIEEVIHVGTLT